MAHTRHRKFNTRDTYPEQKLDNDLAQAVVARGTTIFLRGQCPQDLDTAQNINSHDPVEQTHKVMQNIRQLVQECGGGLVTPSNETGKNLEFGVKVSLNDNKLVGTFSLFQSSGIGSLPRLTATCRPPRRAASMVS